MNEAHSSYLFVAMGLRKRHVRVGEHMSRQRAEKLHSESEEMCRTRPTASDLLLLVGLLNFALASEANIFSCGYDWSAFDRLWRRLLDGQNACWRS